MTASSHDVDLERVARAIDYLSQERRAQPSLEAVARHVGLSPFHTQRLFQRCAGVSPKRLLQVLTVADARALLEASRSVLDASLEVGLSGPSRLHDVFLRVEHMTPGQYKAQAKGLEVAWAIAPTPLGRFVLGALDGRVCAAEFLDGSEAEAVTRLRARWPEARLVHRPQALERAGNVLRARLCRQPHEPLGVVLRGTPLQLAVWDALVRVPPGALISYQDLATRAGSPRAVRAVGTAVGQNPLAVLIPCHRVLRATGVFGQYRWGEARKRLLVAWEQAALEPRAE